MSLIELLQLLKERWYFMVLFPLVFALATAAFCWGVMTDDYKASCSLYVLTKSTAQSTNSSNTNSNSISTGQLSVSGQIADDLSVLAKSQKVLNAAASELGMDSLNGYSISVSNKDANRVISLSVTGKVPQATAAVTNAIAKQMGIFAVDMMDLEAVNVMDEAQVPTSPSGPDRIRYTLIAALAGLVAAIALILVLDMLHTTIKSPEEAEEEFGLPVLGRMPKVKGMN